MSASAKPVGKVLKSLLAVVLAISLCPLMPAEKAQAQEAGSDVDVDFAITEKQSEDAGDGTAPSIASQAGDSKSPIVDWTTSGTCRWMIDASGCLTIEPITV